MMAGMRQWRALRDGEELLTVTGPDAEAIARAAAGPGGTVECRDAERPVRGNGYSLHGPWIEQA
jgi:hypothetical protein